VGQSAEQVKLGFDPAEDFLVGDEKLDVAGCPEITDACAAEMPD
jgi:hypothetical protein